MAEVEFRGVTKRFGDVVAVDSLSLAIAELFVDLLADPLPALPSNQFGGFASGLIFFSGVHKPSFDAYRVPIYLPSTSTRSGRSLEVWGCVRPAHYFRGAPQSVQIQYQNRSAGALASARATTPSTAAGRPGRREVSGGGGSDMCAQITAVT